ncbi:hypothetical protein D3C74_406400 [compost metagenome]
MHAGHLFMGEQVGAERVPQALVHALADEMLIELAHDWAKSVGVVAFFQLPRSPADAQPVVRQGRTGEQRRVG